MQRLSVNHHPSPLHPTLSDCIAKGENPMNPKEHRCQLCNQNTENVRAYARLAYIEQNEPISLSGVQECFVLSSLSLSLSLSLFLSLSLSLPLIS